MLAAVVEAADDGCGQLDRVLLESAFFLSGTRQMPLQLHPLERESVVRLANCGAQPFDLIVVWRAARFGLRDLNGAMKHRLEVRLVGSHAIQNRPSAGTAPSSGHLASSAELVIVPNSRRTAVRHRMEIHADLLSRSTSAIPSRFLASRCFWLASGRTWSAMASQRASSPKARRARRPPA